MADTTQGATIAFGTSSFTAKMTAINVNGVSREAYNTSHLETTDYHTFIPADLTDPGEVELTFQYDPNEQPPINADAENITITYPSSSYSTSDATHAGSGFLTDFSIGNEINGLREATATLKMSGSWTFTAGT